MFIRQSVLLLMIFTYCIFSQSNNNCSNEDCHSGIHAKKYIHSPVNDGCLTCHEYGSGKHPADDGPEYELIESSNDLCSSCHSKEVSKKIIHQPFLDGKCNDCHTPHSSNIEGLLLGNSMKETCSKCHSLDIEGNKFGHGPYMSDQCTSCHLGHESEYRAMLTEEEPYLCFKCHLGKEEDLELPNVHPAFEEGCLGCHSPHTSKAANMLLTDDNQICFSCHTDVEEDVKKSKVIHAPLNEKGMCAACHTPHAGELTKLLITEQPNLCFNCHSENINNKEKYIDIFGRMNKAYVHNPIFEGECTDCHQPHISKYTNLLLAAFPKGNYTKPKIDNFAMCFRCHDSKKITNKITNTDTGFRDGTKNLHTVHVMKKKSISCQSCHDMHGADNKHIIGNFVYFGKWEMPINYISTDNGGSCLPGCHVQYSYDRDKN